MTALMLGMTSALALGLIWWWGVNPGWRRSPRRSRLRELLVDAGLPQWSPTRLLVACAALALFAGTVMYSVSQSLVIAVVAGAIVSGSPIAWVRHLQRRRHAALRRVWPDAIEHLASGVRAGLSLSEALGQLGEGGPEELRSAFLSFSNDYRSSGSFSLSLDLLKGRLADPVGDRV